VGTVVAAVQSSYQASSW